MPMATIDGRVLAEIARLDAVPTLRAMAARLNAGVTTVHRAYARLGLRSDHHTRVSPCLRVRVQPATYDLLNRVAQSRGMTVPKLAASMLDRFAVRGVASRVPSMGIGRDLIQ